MRISLFAVWLLLCCGQLSAQLAVRNFTTEDGLPSNNVYSVFPDHNGFLWFGTDNGIARFDGKHFKVLTSADGLADNDVFGFFEDSHQRLWLRTFSGKACYLKDGKIFTSRNDSSLRVLDRSAYVYSIAEWKDSLYFTTVIGENVRYFNGQTRRLGIDVWLTLLPIGNRLYGANYQYVNDIVSGNTEASFCTEKQYPTRAASVGNDIYISSDNDIWRLPMNGGHILSQALHVGCNTFFLANEGDSALLVGSGAGAFRMHTATGNIDTLLAGFPISYVSRDYEGGLWITSLNQGVFYFGNGQSQLFGVSRPEKPHAEYMFGTTPGDSQWFCIGQNCDLAFLDAASSWSVVLAPRKRTGGRITSYMWLNKDSLAISGERIGDLYRRSERKIYPDAVRPSMRTIVPLPEDSVMFSTGNAYFLRGKYELLSDCKIPIFRSDAILRVNCTVFFNGKLLAGTNDGVFEINHGESRNIAPASKVLHDRVTTMAVDEKGILWVGLANRGIAKFDGDTAMALGTISNIPNVRRIRIAKDGSIWACSHLGIFQFREVSKGKYIRESYTPEYGYPVANAWDVLPMQGYTYAATEQGLIRFSAISNQIPPRLFVEEIRYGDTLWNVAGKKVMQADRPGKRLKLRFAGINFRNNGALTYRYRIAEIDDGWQITRSTEIQYADVRAGEYHLELKAVSATGMESEVFRFQFVVPPQFWQTIWFALVCLLLCLGLVVMVYRWQVGRLRLAHQRAQEKSQKEIERIEAELYVRELEQKALRLQMNPHFIFNALNTIQGLYAQKDIPKAKEYINKLSMLIREILELSGHSLIGLDREVEVASNYLEVMLYRFENLFTYSVFVDEDIQLNAISVPPMILQPIVENAVIHGIAPKGGNGKIDIRIEKSGEDILISVRDNGVGFKHSQSQRSSASGKNKSKGMKLTKERLSQQWQDGEDGFLVEEITDENQQPIGTIVTIRLSKRKKV
jgi:signal transduction histidine kinase